MALYDVIYLKDLERTPDQSDSSGATQFGVDRAQNQICGQLQRIQQMPLYRLKCFYICRLYWYIKIASLLCYFLGSFVVEVFPAIVRKMLHSLLTDSLAWNLSH
jgi:hypothetical protein